MYPGVLCLLYRLSEASEVTYNEKQAPFSFEMHWKIHFPIEAIRVLINTIKVLKIGMKRIAVIFPNM